MVSPLYKYMAPMLRGAGGRKVGVVNLLNQPRYYGNTHPIPATMDGIERVRAYPITPPTIHRMPITSAGTADWRVVGEGPKAAYH